MATALLIIGEYRSFDIMKYKIMNIVKANNCDVFAVFTNYKKQNIDLNSIVNLKDYKILTQEDIKIHLQNLNSTKIINFKEQARIKYNNEYKVGRSGKMFTDVMNGNNEFFKQQYTQVYLYQQAMQLVNNKIKQGAEYKYVIKMRPDMLFDYQINICEIFDYEYSFYVNCMKVYKAKFMSFKVLDLLYLFVIFKNNFTDADLYVSRMKNNCINTLRTSNIDTIISKNKDTFTYTTEPFDQIFMGFHYKSHSHNLINKLISHIESLLMKHTVNNIYNNNFYKDLRILTDKLVYMYHDYTFVSTIDTAVNKYVQSFDDYFNADNLIDGPYFYCIEDIIYNKLFINDTYPLFIYNTKQSVIRNIL